MSANIKDAQFFMRYFDKDEIFLQETSNFLMVRLAASRLITTKFIHQSACIICTSK